MIQDFSTDILGSNLISTGVFWDVQDCSILKDLDPCLIYDKLKDSLVDLGYSGDLKIYAYSEKKTFTDDELMKYQNANIHFLPQVPEDKFERVHRMMHDMFFWAFDTGRRPVNLIVIANNIEGKIDLVYCLRYLKPLGYNVCLIEPAKFPSGWGRFLPHLKETIGPKVMSEQTMVRELPPTASAAVVCNLNVHICLDICKCCSGFCGFLAKNNIYLALEKYGDSYSNVVDFATYGGKEVKVHKILWDISTWLVAYLQHPVSFMVISKKVPASEANEFNRVLDAMRLRGYNFCIVQPDGDDDAASEILKSCDKIISCAEELKATNTSFLSGSDVDVGVDDDDDDDDDDDCAFSLETDSDYDDDSDYDTEANQNQS